MIFSYTEGYGDNAAPFDPVGASIPYFENNEASRFTTELLRYVVENKLMTDPRLADCIGCDVVRLAEACHGKLLRGGHTSADSGDILDVVIIIQDNWTYFLPLWELSVQESLEALKVKALWESDDDDHIVVVRNFEPWCGHGMRWFRITKEQVGDLLIRWEALGKEANNLRIKASGD